MRFFTYFFLIFRAHLGPARTFEEREKIKNMTISLSNIFFYKIIVFDLQTAFVNGKTVFFRFLAEIRLRMSIKSLQKASSRPISCKFRTTCTLPGGVRTLP